MASSKSKKKKHVPLACAECKSRILTNKSRGKTPNPPKLELRKHCKICRKHTLHRETK